MAASDLLDSDGVAVLTGGASGFGLEAATRCAELGMSVAILDMDAAAMQEAEITLSAAGAAGVLAIRCDVSSWDACVSAADEIAARFAKPIAFLFNNAGIGGSEGYAGSVLNGTPSDDGWRKVFDVNLFVSQRSIRQTIHFLGQFLPKLSGS